MNTLVFDSEFIWAEGLARFDNEGVERVPHPPNAVIEALAYVAIDYEPAKVVLAVGSGDTERDRVGRFIKVFEAYGPRLVTFGGRQADIPLLVARQLHHGIVSQRFVASIAQGYRFKHENQLDLHDVLGSYGAQRSGRLTDWARCIGWPGKGEVDGSKVAELLKQPEGRALVTAYCLCDAVQTAALLIRYELALGAIDPGTYQQLASALLEAAKRDARTAELAASVDEQRFLLQPKEAA